MATRTKENLEDLKNLFANARNWKEIEKEEFHNTLGKTDIIYNVEDEYLFPYVGIWKTRGGRIVAKTIPQTMYTPEFKIYLSQ